MATLILEVIPYFARSWRPFRMTSSNLNRYYRIIHRPRNLWKNVSNISAGSVPGNGVAPLRWQDISGYCDDKITSLRPLQCHYNDVIMSAMAAQITGVSVVCLIVCSGADQRKHKSSASLTFVRGIHRWPVNSPHKGPVTRKMFPFDDVIMHSGPALGSLNNFQTQVMTYLRKN